MNLYFTSVNVPHHIRAQEYFIHFSSTSPHASALDQFDAFIMSLQKDEWHEAFDCQLHQEIIFQLYAHLFSGDNPMQAELADNTGQNSRWWCRSDESGGTKEERESDVGYHALYQIPLARNPNKTVEIIIKQLQVAATGIQSAVDKLVTENGVKDRIASLWIPQLLERSNNEQHTRIELEATRDSRLSETTNKKKQKQIKDTIKAEIQDDVLKWLFTQPPERYAQLPEDSPLRHTFRGGDHYNILFDVPGVDPHADTPCKILHTILLGIDKYIWMETSKKWNSKKDAEFEDRLSKVSIDGLTVFGLFCPSYILQFKNSLIGRQLKLLQQLAVFCLLPASDSERKLFNLWKANGELGALLWFPEIEDMETYLCDLDVAVDNVLDCWGAFDPARILYKYKLHLLKHLRRDITRFGPAVLYSTETFEGWNSIFRTCSVLSNHQSPSQDIAETLAGMEKIKHLISGGWWKSKDGTYVCAGKGVIEHFENNHHLQHCLGLSSTEFKLLGTVEKVPKMAQKCAKLSTYTNSLCGDKCKPLSWVLYQFGVEGQVFTGRICKILVPSGISDESTAGITLITCYNLSPFRHPHLNMPVLSIADFIDIVPSKIIQFSFNVQHEPGFGDSASTALTDADPKYIVNLHALHNAHLIRKTLPCNLTRPMAIHDGDGARLDAHTEWAQQLQISGPAKQQAARESAAAKQSLKKQAANNKAAATQGTSNGK
ncbi:hypothetical protein AN958_12897 [Leucoagaricus sp. SymC.cos]|nr:hypothetical protein AN958_12897 [Leucoagaricus sp. SymC.cos]